MQPLGRTFRYTSNCSLSVRRDIARMKTLTRSNSVKSDASPDTLQGFVIHRFHLFRDSPQSYLLWNYFCSKPLPAKEPRLHDFTSGYSLSAADGDLHCFKYCQWLARRPRGDSLANDHGVLHRSRRILVSAPAWGRVPFYRYDAA